MQKRVRVCGHEGVWEMSQKRHKGRRQQALVKRQGRRRRRLAMFIGGPLLVALAVMAVVVLSRTPGYSGFDVVGKQPAIIQVFLPG